MKQQLNFLCLTHIYWFPKACKIFVNFYTYKAIITLLQLKGGLHSVPGKSFGLSSEQELQQWNAVN